MKQLIMIIALINVCILFSTNLHVGDGYTYSTITAAYNAAQNGDKIIIHPDDYIEAIPTIHKDICITGSTLNPANVTIENPYPSSPALDFSQDVECEVKYLTLHNSYNGCRVYRAIVTFDHVIAENNDFSGIGSPEGSDVTIISSILRYNGYYGAHLDQPEDRDNDIIDTQIYHNGPTTGSYGGGLGMDDGSIVNCTIAYNTKGVHCWGSSVNLTNNIIYGNYYSQISNTTGTVEYCCVEDGYTGTGNISSDPLFVNPAAGNLNLQWSSAGRSPCIDTGSPSYSDPDGTRSDMGALGAQWHAIETYSYPTRRYHWICYPVIDDVYTAENNASNFFYNIRSNIDDLIHNGDHAFDDGFGNWTYPWDATDPTDPVDGFKLKVTGSCSMDKIGFLADPDTEISLGANETHWVGYFIEESQHPLDALADVLDDLTQIKHYGWTLTKGPLGWFGPSNYTLNYGDMVELTTESSCSFAWNDNLEPQTPLCKSATSHYVVDEDMDYTPVYLDMSEYAENMPKEVGMFAGEKLIGATVVDAEQTQINAYIDDVEGEEEVSFELYYGGRSASEPCKTYAVRSKNSLAYKEDRRFFEKGSTYYQVVLGSDGNTVTVPTPEILSIGNYPNPFNPETTIAFSLPQDGDVCIKVYNARGQLVKTLVDSNMNAGNHEVVWNGHDEMNRQVGSGIYFCQMKTAGKTMNRKLLMMK